MGSWGRRSQDGPEMAWGCPRMAQDGRRMAPRCPQDGPGWPHFAGEEAHFVGEDGHAISEQGRGAGEADTSEAGVPLGPALKTKGPNQRLKIEVNAEDLTRIGPQGPGESSWILGFSNGSWKARVDPSWPKRASIRCCRYVYTCM